jgi:outer membrane protein assembly factor BamB
VNGNILVCSPDKTALIEADSGIRIWEQNIGTLYTPLVNNGYIFILTNDRYLVCLSMDDGTMLWKQDLAEHFSKNVQLLRPIISNSLISVFDNFGNCKSFNPANGSLAKQNQYKLRLSDTPLIINKKLYCITENADIHALQ